ncbi:MAG TPA: O-antigen ligase family protein [Anaerolineae bacterium]|nr:O-antigen ligase family protein [Anaerolineae bacterium]
MRLHDGHSASRNLLQPTGSLGALRLLAGAAAALLGGMVAISLADASDFRAAPFIVGVGGFVLLAVSLRLPMTLVFAVILYESLLSWQEASQIAVLGYNRLLYYAVMVGGFSMAVVGSAILRRRRVALTWVDVTLVLYLAAAGLSTRASVDPATARPGLTYLAAGALCIYTVRLTIRTQAHKRQVLAFLLGFMVFEGLLGAFQFVTRQGLLYTFFESGADLVPRAPGTLGNGLGWYLSVGYILAFNLWLYSRTRTQAWLFAIVTASIAIGLIASNTRGSWVDCAIATVLSLLPALRARPRRALSIVAMAGAVVLIALTSSLLRGRVESIVGQVNDPIGNTFGFRLYMWRAAVDMFGANPLVGVGPDNFKPLMPNYADDEGRVALHLDRGATYNVHHAGLQVLAETGIVGGAAYALFVAAFVGQAWRVCRALKDTDRGWGMALLVFALTSTLSMIYGGYAYGGYTQIGRLYFVLVGLTLAQANMLQRTRRSV